MSVNPHYHNPSDGSLPKAVLVLDAELVPSAPPAAPAPQRLAVSLPTNVCSTHDAKVFLTEHKWPPALQDALLQNLTRFASRHLILDDSSSMMEEDGHRIVAVGKSYKTIPCSRWTEMAELVRFQASFAMSCRYRTQFRFLNGGAPILLGCGDDNEAEKMRVINATLDETPNGATPLCRHIQEVVAEISAVAEQLRATRQLACVVIVTDGEASDGDIAAAMRPLKDLPVWVVVRLCTDSEKVIEYWDNIDKVLELQIDVIDDFKGEAEQIKKYNDWLTYSEILHRIREFGVYFKELDLVDEAPLSAEQVLGVCKLIFNNKNIPHPDIDWPAFAAVVTAECRDLHKVWSPVESEARDWIDLKRLAKKRKHNKGCSVS